MNESREARNMIQPRRSDRVRLRRPGAWYDGRKGLVIAAPEEWPDRATVQLDGGGRALAFWDDLEDAETSGG